MKLTICIVESDCLVISIPPSCSGGGAGPVEHGGAGGVGGPGEGPGDGEVPGDGEIPGDGEGPGDGEVPGDGEIQVPLNESSIYGTSVFKKNVLNADT